MTKKATSRRATTQPDPLAHVSAPAPRAGNAFDHLDIVRVGAGTNDGASTRMVYATNRRGYLPGAPGRPSGSVDPDYVDRHTGRPAEPGSLHGAHPGYVRHIDSDTLQHGFDGPYEAWEGDSRALWGVITDLVHDGLIATDPGLRAPLRHALFERLHVEGRGHDNDNLIADLRAILDAHDPAIAPGAPGAGYLSREDADAAEAAEKARRVEAGEPLEGQEPRDAAASAILHSRWRAAFEAYAKAKALLDAAREEEAAGFPEVADRLRVRAEEITGRAAAMTADQPQRTRDALAAKKEPR